CEKLRRLLLWLFGRHFASPPFEERYRWVGLTKCQYSLCLGGVTSALLQKCNIHPRVMSQIEQKENTESTPAILHVAMLALRSAPACAAGSKSMLCIEEFPMSRLQGKVAIVTGAAQGIGAAYARALAGAGAAVMVADVIEPGGLVSEIEAAGGRAIG